MKSKIFIAFTVMLLSLPLIISAQQKADSVKLWNLYPGYVVTLEGDTIEGHLVLSNLVANQRRVLFYRDPDDPETKVKYKPKDIKAYQVGPRHYDSFRFQPVNEARGYHFFLRKIDGPISLYEWYYEPESRSKERIEVDEENILNSKIDLSFSEEDLSGQTVLIKLGGDPINLNSLKYLTNFKKNMGELVSECEELVARIEAKEEGYTMGFHENIIREFNECYSEKGGK